MATQISVPLPLNLTAGESSLYMPYQTYEYRLQQIKYFKNVLITFTGFCINRRGLIKESHHAYNNQYYDYLSEAAWYYQDTIENPSNLIILDDDITYLAIHHPWFNYYHWLCESIFRLWIVRGRLEKLTLILPEYYKDADFIVASLKPFQLKNIFYIPNGKSLLVRKICLPQIKSVCDSYNIRHLKQVRRFYREYVSHSEETLRIESDRLYVSRNLAKRRKVVNESEILNILSSYNFTTFYPERHSFLEQVAIFSQVKYLVAEHGSGLTNMLFMGENTAVLELHKDRTNELAHPSFLFWYMADALGIQYYHQSCETRGKEDYFESDYWVDPQRLEQNLIKMIAEKTK